MKYYIKTFGCAANEADSERIASSYQSRGYGSAHSINDADDVVINTCMVRQSAVDRVYGFIHNLALARLKGRKVKIILTGCLVGMAIRDKTGAMLRTLRKKMPAVDEYVPIEEIGFDFAPLRSDPNHALVPISNGCNNFCTFCVVPFTRGREKSRPFREIIGECRGFAKQGIGYVTLIGQNVNSYGADLVKQSENGEYKFGNKTIRPVYVKHLGRLRIPTLFPYLLTEICRIKGIGKIDFISSNPWDFSDELIGAIAENPAISRHIHLPVQSGDTTILRKMNRWYTREEYLALVRKIRKKIPDVRLSTDIIVGFPGETNEQFRRTVSLIKKIGFVKAYISMYSDRPMTTAHTTMKDDIPYTVKKQRWLLLDTLVNKRSATQRSDRKKTNVSKKNGI